MYYLKTLLSLQTDYWERLTNKKHDIGLLAAEFIIILACIAVILYFGADCIPPQ